MESILEAQSEVFLNTEETKPDIVAELGGTVASSQFAESGTEAELKDH
jgi:hypothetical protein